MNRLTFTALALLCAPAAASAAVITLTANLSGANEVPVVTTNATGNATMTVDSITGVFSMDISFSDLGSNTRDAHFHNAPAGVNGAVFFWLFGTTNPGSTPRIPGGVTSFTGTLTGTIPANRLEALFAGNVYINVHTDINRGGEIRGNLVPGASSAAMLGLAGLAAARRRRV